MLGLWPPELSQSVGKQMNDRSGGSMQSTLISDFSNRLDAICQAGGPTVDQYETLMEEIRNLYLAVERQEISQAEIRDALDSLGAPFSIDTIQGYGLRKPRGYAGDFEMIDKIYLYHKSKQPELAAWDEFFHSQHGPRAVRNRKSYFHRLLDELPENAKVLKLGCGPGRGMFEWLSEHPEREVQFNCIDIDENAIKYAEHLNRAHSNRIAFHKKNVFRFTPPAEEKYDLIWAAGLFDYFDDKAFVMLGKRFIKNVKFGGELVIGNFSTYNPSRPYMELFGEWYLHHRSEAALTGLGKAIHPCQHCRIGMEKERVNLFLHIPQA